MKTIPVCALLLLLSAPSYAGVAISFDSEDSRTTLAPRHNIRDARTAITTKDNSVVLMLTKDAIAVQLTDRALAQMETKKDAGFLEELLVSGVKLAVGKAVEIPIANTRSVEYRNGELFITNDQNKPVFTTIKVNGSDVLRDFSAADAARFVNAFRIAKAAR
jgi:hypothetical protein